MGYSLFSPQYPGASYPSLRPAGLGTHLALRFAAFILIALSMVFTHTADAVEPEPANVRLMPMWSPQAQFAGYYMAREKGIYAHHGLQVRILEGGPGRSPLQSLTSGEADFAVLWLATALQQSDEGLRLINLAQIIQRSSLMLVTKKTSGISFPDDLNGRKVSLWDGELSLPVLAFLDKYHLHPQRISQAYTVNLFLRDGIDAASAMWYNEYHTILNAGINPDELQVFSLHDHGITFPEDGLYSLEHVYRKDPARARAFAQASLEGWRYAFAHPDETLEVILRIMRQAKVPASRAHQQWMLERMRDLIMPAGTNDTMGPLQADGYQAAATILLDHGVIRKIPDYQAFTGGN